MGTIYAELWQALADPFDKSEVKTRESGKQYVTARTVMNRLDKVIGPENWTDEYWAVGTEGNDSLICKLTIKLPDGGDVFKQGIGSRCELRKGMSRDDCEKAAMSEALKIAAVKFGIARYLYRDGVVDYEGSTEVRREEQPSVVRGSQGREIRSDIDVPTSGRALFRAIKMLEESSGRDGLIRLVNGWAKDRGNREMMVEWPREMVSDAWVFAKSLVNGIEPVVNSSEVREDGSDGMERIRSLRRQLSGLCECCAAKVNGIADGEKVDPKYIRDELDLISCSIKDGWYIKSFALLNDEAELLHLNQAAEDRLREIVEAPIEAAL